MQRAGKNDARRADGVSLGRFLTTPIPPIVRTDEKSRLDITVANYRRLYKAAGKFASRFGYKALPFPESSDPSDGLVLLYSFLHGLSRSMQVFHDEDAPAPERVSLVDETVITDGYSGYYIPIRATYESMSPAFGLLVRRFVRALSACCGMDGFDCTVTDLLQDWIESLAEDEVEEDARKAATYYGFEPGTVGEKLTDYEKNVTPLSEAELLSYKPVDKKEKSLHDFLVSGSHWLRPENCFDILSYAEFETDEQWTDEYCDAYVPICNYFAVVWDTISEDPMMGFIESAINESLQSGAAPQGLVVRHDISDGKAPAAAESLAVTRFLNYIIDLRIRLEDILNNKN